MMSLEEKNCPGCGGAELTGPHVVPSQPVVQNYRFPDISSAQNVQRADLFLRQCTRCGLIFNQAFDAGLVPYDERYENSQCHSGAFKRHMEQTIKRAMAKIPVQGAKILEIGCGKGDFLRMICEKAQARGMGYDTTYEGPPHFETPLIDFHSEYLSARDIDQAYDLVLCRHVVEHVPRIGSFLKEIHAIATAAGSPRVLLETPAFEWIQNQGSFWDVFYEHCNYFSKSCLSSLCQRSGFKIMDHRATFGEQYQVIEVRPLGHAAPPDYKGIESEADLTAFAKIVHQSKSHLLQRLEQAGARRGWAVWGAGGKGVALVNQLDFPAPSFVIDANPAKQGCVIPGSAVPVVAPGHPDILNLSAVLIANPNYFEEIKLSLDALGYKQAALTA